MLDVQEPECREPWSMGQARLKQDTLGQPGEKIFRSRRTCWIADFLMAPTGKTVLEPRAAPRGRAGGREMPVDDTGPLGGAVEK